MNRVNKIQVSEDFLNSLSDSAANKFIRKSMVNNYTQAILFHHPNKRRLDETKILAQVKFLITTIFNELEKISSTPEKLYPTLLEIGRKEDKLKIWFDEFEESYDNYKEKSKLPFINDNFAPFLKKYKTLIDFGCGSGEITQYIAEHNNLEVTGVDVLDYRNKQVKDEGKIHFEIADFSKSPQNLGQFDIGLMHAMLHHVSNRPEEIADYIVNASKVIRDGLLVVEDAIYAQSDTTINVKGINSLQKSASSQQDFKEFLQLSVASQEAVSIILDLLSNSLVRGIPEMNFPFGCQRLSIWIEIFTKADFSIKEINVLGCQKNFFHRMSQVLFVLDKKAIQ